MGRKILTKEKFIEVKELLKTNTAKDTAKIAEVSETAVGGIRRGNVNFITLPTNAELEDFERRKACRGLSVKV